MRLKPKRHKPPKLVDSDETGLFASSGATPIRRDIPHSQTFLCRNVLGLLYTLVVQLCTGMVPLKVMTMMCVGGVLSSTYGWAAPRRGLQGCTATLSSGNGGATVLPSLLGETMPRGFKEVEDWCPVECPAQGHPTTCLLPRNSILIGRCVKTYREMRTESISRRVGPTKHQKT
jgi:hypothetical protein